MGGANTSAVIWDIPGIPGWSIEGLVLGWLILAVDQLVSVWVFDGRDFGLLGGFLLAEMGG